MNHSLLKMTIWVYPNVLLATKIFRLHTVFRYLCIIRNFKYTVYFNSPKYLITSHISLLWLLKLLRLLKLFFTTPCTRFLSTLFNLTKPDFDSFSFELIKYLELDSLVALVNLHWLHHVRPLRFLDTSRISPIRNFWLQSVFWPT